MAEKDPVVICTCELDTGYIFKNYFNFISLRGRPIITFTADKIIAENETADAQQHNLQPSDVAQGHSTLYGCGTLYGDEINLTWNESIPPERRQLHLTFDSARIQSTFGRILKKDQARVFIVQLRHAHNKYDFDSENSSSDFSIYLSQGTGGDGREKLQSIAARRADSQGYIIQRPLCSAHCLVIPIKVFRQIIDSFSKCRRQMIRLCYYANTKMVGGEAVKMRPGIMLTTNMSGGHTSSILEKFGEIPEEESVMGIALNLGDLNIDESTIVRPNASPAFQLVLEEERAPEPNEFIFSCDKISIFSRLASMHNEGSVRIYYQPGCHLRIAYRFGSFGECELFLHNRYVTFV